MKHMEVMLFTSTVALTSTTLQISQEVREHQSRYAHSSSQLINYVISSYATWSILITFQSTSKKKNVMLPLALDATQRCGT